MRAFGEPDAFPSGDLVLRRAAGDCSTRELDRRAEAWRPWRAYAVMLLWRGAADGDEASRRMRHAPPDPSSKRRDRAGRSVDVFTAHGTR